MLVSVTMRRPIDSLFADLQCLTTGRANGPKTLTRVGHCLAPGTIAAAVYPGHRYAREFGAARSDDILFRRELPAPAID